MNSHEFASDDGDSCGNLGLILANGPRKPFGAFGPDGCYPYPFFRPTAEPAVPYARRERIGRPLAGRGANTTGPQRPLNGPRRGPASGKLGA